jgi:hypothetical protein
VLFFYNTRVKKNFSREGAKMSKRYSVSKGASAQRFKGQVMRTKMPNMRQVMRGGWRM